MERKKFKCLQKSISFEKKKYFKFLFIKINFIITIIFIWKKINLFVWFFLFFSDDFCYIVGAESLKYWRRLATEKFNEELNEKYNTQLQSNQHNGQEEPSIEEDDENDVLNFNEDLLCEHNCLRTPDSSRKIVPKEAWDILRKYFPDAREFPINVNPCDICEVNFLLF